MIKRELFMQWPNQTEARDQLIAQWALGRDLIGAVTVGECLPISPRHQVKHTVADDIDRMSDCQSPKLAEAW